ncbi:unnamed protein product [Rodentolepis nana]|uniref:TPR_REGION domain-containing protein n=1 Tax=Rodentolepis nana TaxID=102285 RepID=A0A0R3TGQ0_RODNA|nr:unnamed protein product [Rodentolepis nana]
MLARQDGETELDDRLKLHEKGDSLVAIKDYYYTVSRMVMKCGNIRQYNSDFAGCKTDFERVCFLLKLFQGTFNSRGNFRSFLSIPIVNLTMTQITENREKDEDDSDTDDDTDDEEEEEEEKPKGIEVLPLPKKLEDLVASTGKDDELSMQCLRKGYEYQANNEMRTALHYFTYSLFYAKSRSMKREAFLARGNLFQQLHHFDGALVDLTKADKWKGVSQSSRLPICSSRGHIRAYMRYFALF